MVFRSSGSCVSWWAGASAAAYPDPITLILERALVEPGDPDATVTRPHVLQASESVAAKNKKDMSLRDLMTKPAEGPRGGKEDDCSLDADEPESPVLHSFLEALFTTQQEDLQADKMVLPSDL
ncbi:hypothetical protein NDU88_003444 [Pleurodeles waltl]|uniref:Uncharacterized protein n=1 Tax=Pleurodeles waltl TaxID=8319 RepID=A0AAV7LFU9_PLEWA|nr:hypothetical protein NDU88_003444 [Pleurodeles waltl]